MEKWLVYEHISPTGKVYVGITQKEAHNRWGNNGAKYLGKQKNGNYTHPYFARAIRKYGWDNFIHKVIACNLEEKTAKNMEKDLISFYKKIGSSYNITNGGDSRLGMVFNHSKHTIYLIKLHHRRGNSKETALKIKDTLTGRKRPEEVKLILRKAHSSECIPVKQYDDYGNLLASYNSIMDAERATGVRNSGISACLKGRVKHAGGFIWKQN